MDLAIEINLEVNQNDHLREIADQEVHEISMILWAFLFGKLSAYVYMRDPKRFGDDIVNIDTYEVGSMLTNVMNSWIITVNSVNFVCELVSETQIFLKADFSIQISSEVITLRYKDKSAILYSD